MGFLTIYLYLAIAHVTEASRERTEQRTRGEAHAPSHLPMQIWDMFQQVQTFRLDAVLGDVLAIAQNKARCIRFVVRKSTQDQFQ